MSMAAWTPPPSVGREEIVRISKEVLGRPDIPFDATEHVVSVDSVGMTWDLGFKLYDPIDQDDAAIDPMGRKVGVFILHGGSADHRHVDPISRLLAGKYGVRVLAGTFPGRFYFPDDSRDWPGDTIRDDGTVRTPIWQVGEEIGRDQYEIVKDDKLTDRYGIRTYARAKPGTRFYDRLAGWPVAFEEGMIEANRRFLPEADYSIYGNGHSTGGPFIFMLSQRIPNFQGVISAEHSPFGYICAQRDRWSGAIGRLAGQAGLEHEDGQREDRFYDLYIRTWRDLARYRGPEALGREGGNALMRLPTLMEGILDRWEEAKVFPQFKAEYIVTHGVEESLREAADVTADRLQLNEDERRDLSERYVSYTRELRGRDVAPVPPILFCVAAHSRDHSPEVYQEVILPAFRAMDPAPRHAFTEFGAGGHAYWLPEDDLPFGIAPAVVAHWNDGIRSGFFV